MRRVIKNENALRLVLLLTALPGLFFCKSADYFTCFGLLLGFIASIPVEERFVQFENTRSPIRIALRLVGGLVIFFAADKLLKLPFDKEFLASGQYAALLVRAIRYTVISFLEFGVYPMIFKYTKNIGSKRDK